MVRYLSSTSDFSLLKRIAVFVFILVAKLGLLYTKFGRISVSLQIHGELRMNKDFLQASSHFIN